MCEGALRAPTDTRCQHAAIVSCHEPKVRDAPRIVGFSLGFCMEAKGRYAPRRLRGPSIWQSFDATSRRCVEHPRLGVWDLRNTFKDPFGDSKRPLGKVWNTILGARDTILGALGAQSGPRAAPGVCAIRPGLPSGD